MIAAIDIGGTSTKLGLVSGGSVITRARIPTTGYPNAEAFADALAEAVRALEPRTGGPITAVGIGAPNGDQRSGTIDRAPNLPWKTDLPLARMLSERLGLPCTLGNDANAAALGEWIHGAGQGTNDLLVVTLGTGLGSGFIVDGRLVLGPHGNAGEIGHAIIVIDGRTCTCGRKGCLEAYVSIRGIRQTYLELADSGEALEQDGVKPIAEAAARGEDAAVQTFRDTARWLAVALANAVAHTAPTRIVLCGGIARSGEVLMNPLRRLFAASLLNIYQGKVDLVVSGLAEDDAGLLGAAALAEI